jgi:hypothetical protein
MDHGTFAALDTVKGRPIHLRNTIQIRLMTPIGLFYEQAGATVYFLVTERGEEGRLAFFRYLSDYYSGRARSPGWKALGFESAEAFDAAFVEFLRKVR